MKDLYPALHPRLRAKLAELNMGYWVDPNSGLGTQAGRQHMSVWWQLYAGKIGWSLAAWFGAAAVAFGIGLARDAEQMVVLSLLLVLAGVGTSIYQLVRSEKTVYAPELDALLPMLPLDETERAYAEAMLALYGSGQVAQDHRNELSDHLNGLLDLDGRLLEQIKLLGEGEARSGSDLASDRRRLEDQLAEAEDPLAREALEASLRLVEQREAARARVLPTVQRLVAERELIRQTLLSFRETLSRAGSSALPEMKGLRDRLAAVRREAEDIDAAVREVMGS